MKVNTLRIDCFITGGSTVAVWAECHNARDIDLIIAWLTFAKQMAKSWTDTVEHQPEEP